MSKSIHYCIIESYTEGLIEDYYKLIFIFFASLNGHATIYSTPLNTGEPLRIPEKSTNIKEKGQILGKYVFLKLHPF